MKALVVFALLIIFWIAYISAIIVLGCKYSITNKMNQWEFTWKFTIVTFPLLIGTSALCAWIIS